MNSYNVMDIARYVINYSIDIGSPVSNLKLQKLLYYIQAAFLVEKDQVCFDENILAWRHGPVVKQVYDEFKIYRGEDIEDKQNLYTTIKLNNHDDNLKLEFIESHFDKNIILKTDRKIINKIINSYKDKNAWSIVEKTHKEKPWDETDINKIISIDLIKTYYLENKDKLYA